MVISDIISGKRKDEKRINLQLGWGKNEFWAMTHSSPTSGFGYNRFRISTNYYLQYHLVWGAI